jgi:formylglycine-generating enzyme required for sulfatase activity
MQLSNHPVNSTHPIGTPPRALTGVRAWPAWALVIASMALVVAGVALALALRGSEAGIGLSVAPRLAQPDPAVAQADQMVLTLSVGVTLTLVRVPAGVFLMGSPLTDTEARGDELPQRKPYLDEFWIGQYEVTNAQYDAFAQATGRQRHPSAGGADYPVTNVTWKDALAFCAWASRVTGRPIHLPTEAQWEKAARGSDGREFTWGNESPDATRLNYDLIVKHTTPVGRYSPAGDSPYGAADMAGNVWEWTSSQYWSYPYRAHDGREDPQSSDILELRVLRGGSYIGERRDQRTAARSDSSPDAWGEVVGFRVSLSAPELAAPED